MHSVCKMRQSLCGSLYRCIVGRFCVRQTIHAWLLYLGGRKFGHFENQEQNVVAHSSAEAKYKSMTHGVCELLWLKLLLSELGFLVKGPMNLYYDNKAAIVWLIIQCNMTGPSTLQLISILSKKSSCLIRYAFLLSKPMNWSMCLQKDCILLHFSSWCPSWVCVLFTYQFKGECRSIRLCI